MKLVLTLLARDEADVLDAHLAFHLSAGVDYVIATDHRSTDGTTELLERYERLGKLHLIREDADGFDQSAWVTRMAQLAATEFGADWVIHSDADEFWWPRGGDLKEVLAATPARYGVLRAPIRHFFLRLGDGLHFSERLVVRPLLTAPVNEPGSPLRPNTHILHRADPDAVVTAGNHALRGSRLRDMPDWHPIEVLHFPDRSLDQVRRKYGNWVATLGGREYGDAFEAHEQGRLEHYVRGKVLDEDVVTRGLADGALVEDTRLRDALRTLAGVEPLPESLEPSAYGSPGDRPLPFPRPSAQEEAAYAAEVAVLGEADSVRLQRRLDELEGRLEQLERRPLRRIAARARRTRVHPA